MLKGLDCGVGFWVKGVINGYFDFKLEEIFLKGGYLIFMIIDY